MDKIVAELNKMFRFKDRTEEGDIVVIVTENPQTLSYALVSGFERDTTKKEEWWHVTMQLLSVPPQKIVWTLRTPQFTGAEIFTMGGDRRFIKAVDFSEPGGRPAPKKVPEQDKKKPALRVLK